MKGAKRISIQVVSWFIILLTVLLFLFLFSIRTDVLPNYDEYPSVLRVVISIAFLVLPFVLSMQFCKFITKLLFPLKKESNSTNENG